MKTNILAIAPYKGLVEILNRVSQRYEDVEITTLIGNLDEGVQIMKKLDLSKYDVVISRGGTTEMIKKNFQIATIDVPILDYDIISAVKSVSLYRRSFAIIGFPSITVRARLILEIMEIQADVFTIQDVDELRELINSIDLSKYDTIIGDTITTACVQEVGRSGIIFSSGEASVVAAVEQAVYLDRKMKEQKQSDGFRNVVLKNADLSYVMFNERGEELCSQFQEEVSEEIMKKMARGVENVLSAGHLNIILKNDRDGKKNRNISIAGKNVTYESMRCVIYYIDFDVTLSEEDETWVSMYTRKERYSPTFGILNSKNETMLEISRRVQALAPRSNPVWIEGEQGTGKDSIVKALHAQSTSRNDTLITLNCAFATPRRWTRLFNNVNSPLYQVGYYLYFKNVQMMSEAIQMELVEFLIHSRMERRCRLLFSWENAGWEKEPAKNTLQDYILNEGGGSFISMPSLKERVEDIPDLTYIFINEMNLKFGKHVVGLTGEALGLLDDFAWPHNLNDLKQLLKEAVLVTDSSYITADTVRLLHNQMDGHVRDADAFALPTGTLHEMTKEIIRMVMKEEDNNQVRVAHRLGISRGTLWRRLKEIEDEGGWQNSKGLDERRER